MTYTKAYLNWGRWVVDCECHSAMEINDMPEDVRCLECGCLIRIVYPENHKAICRILDKRPRVKMGSQMIPYHYNWRPGDTLAAMQRENVQHGLH